MRESLKVADISFSENVTDSTSSDVFQNLTLGSSTVMVDVINAQCRETKDNIVIISNQGHVLGPNAAAAIGGGNAGPETSNSNSSSQVANHTTPTTDSPPTW